LAKDSNGQDRNGSPRIVDIANRCGVSVATVCRALQGNGRQSQATIDLVVNTAKEMGYDPARSHAARRLISQRFGQRIMNSMIGMWFVRETMGQSNYLLSVWRGVLEAVSKTDFEVCTCDVWRVEDKRELPGAYRKGDIDGILTMAQAAHWGLPLSLLHDDPNFADRPIVGLVEHLDGGSGVYADNAASGRIVMSHLLDLGHRFIAHFEWGDELDFPTSVHTLRLAAYRETFELRGLSLDRLFPLGWKFGANYRDRSAKRFIEAIRAHPEITAVIAHNDQQAGEVYDALLTAGYRVPQDISLISYDDTDPIIDDHRENMLTSIRLPLMDIGREGTNLLLRRILGEETEDRDIVLPVELMVRKSTGPPKTAS
jgi:DNA-binding LacI/PurR family transcriptional regulator